EIMYDPNTLTELAGEWFELYNPSATTTYQLQNCVIRDNSAGGMHTIAASLSVPPGGYVTLARGASPGFTPSYVYSGLELNNSAPGDRVTLVCAGATVDDVFYDAGAT